MTAAAVQAAARLAPRFAARAAAHDETGEFPTDDFADLRDAGLFGLMVPQRLGGMGAGFAQYAKVAFELARGNGATALVFNMHASITGALAGVPDEMVQALGVPDSFYSARDRVLSNAASGQWYAVAMSERGVGSRLSQLSTSYSAVPGGWQIKGAKTFCSGAGNSDAYLIAARSSADPSLVSQFIVPASTAGLTVEPTWNALGMRATASHDVHIDVTVPEDALVGGIEGLAVLGRAVDAALDGRELRRGVRGGGPRRPSTRPSSTSGHASSAGWRRCARGSAGPTPRWPRPASSSTRRRGGSTTHRATRRPTGGVAGQVARRHHGGRRRGEHAGGGRHQRHPARPSAGAALPRRALRFPATRHVGRVRRLVGGGRPRWRPGERRLGTAMVAIAGLGAAHPPPTAQQDLWTTSSRITTWVSKEDSPSGSSNIRVW
jgi:hypothetical protein